MVKAFSQSAGSYKRYSDAVTGNAITMWTGWRTIRSIWRSAGGHPLSAAARPAGGTAAVGQRKAGTAVFLTIVVHP